MSATARWGEALAAWAIPEPILAAAPGSPWAYPPDLFRRRAERAVEAEPTASVRRALEALPEGGTVLDVGVGAGASSLPLAGRASRIVGVDTSPDMLAAFRETAAARGVAAETVEGRWPDVGARCPVADVVVCGHVLYNVADLGPFVLALDEHARRRVVIEITATHPLSWMNDLWQRFHDLARPDRPTADDAHDVLRELGLPAQRDDEVRPARGGAFERREDAVELIRRRLCLAADRDAELATALGDRLREHDGLWSAGPAEQRVVTLWWDARP